MRELAAENSVRNEEHDHIKGIFDLRQIRERRLNAEVNGFKDNKFRFWI